MKKIIFLLFSLLLAFVTVSNAGAFETIVQEGPININADSISYDGDEDIYHAEGKVLITFSGGDLKADSVTLNRTTNQALAVGHVFLRNGPDILEGEKVSFNIVSRVGVVEDGKMFIAQNHYYIKGEKIEKKSGETYRLENGTVTTCDGDSPDWHIAGKELDLTVDGYGTLKHGRLLVRDLPVLYIPYLIFPAKKTRQTGFLFPSFSYSRDKNGLDVELPFYWAISENTDATFFQRYMEKRGLKEGVEFRYAISPDSFGVFYGDFIDDRMRITEDDGVMSRDWQEDHNRWSYYLNHETTFANGFNLRSDIRRVSDHWYFRDFTSFNYYLDNYSASGQERYRRVSFLGDASLGSLDSTVRLTKNWSLYNMTALMRYTDDFASLNNDTTLQVYPEITLTGFRQPLFNTPLQLEFASGYDHFYRSEGQKGHLGYIAPTFYLPLRLGPYAQVTPQASFRGDVWERTDSETDDGDKHGNRGVFSLGTSLSSEIYRVFNIKSGGLEKIRHAIRPEISYSYIPEVSQDRIPDFLGAISAQNSLSYGITNTIMTRTREQDGKISYSEVMRLKLSQAYDITEARRDVQTGESENRPFSDVYLELDLKPASYLTFAARNVFSVNTGVWWQNNYDLILSDNRGDSLSAGYRYTRDTLEEINLSLAATLTSSLSATYMLKRNLLDGKDVESFYGLQYRKQCWTAAFNVSVREDDMTAMVVFSLYGLGEAGISHFMGGEK